MSEPTSTLSAMTTTPRPNAADVAVRAAEEVLAQAATSLIGPAAGECLLCYVHRMLSEFGCDMSLRFALHYRDVRAPRATALARRLGSGGGYCDCEVFLNAFDLRPEYWTPEVIHNKGDYEEIEEPTWPNPLPACLGVRAGSTQSCGLWWRRGRGWW